ncbi:hypothetical protein BVI2075_40047 [Burkholderia vietnamiensis]|nr:hypothetical protein BVI2075_40047 [Burkholderia vietnamiensis]
MVRARRAYQPFRTVSDPYER